MGINIRETLGDEADSLLGHECKTIERDRLSLPGPDFVDRVLVQSDRPVPVLRNLQQMFDHGRLGGTGYLSILPSTRGSNIRRPRASPRTRRTSTRRTLPSWRLQPTAARSPRRSASSASSLVATRTRSR